MARINHIILSDGTVRDVRDLGLDTTDLQSVGRNAAKVIGFNLYNAANAPFCLGSKAYSSAREAAEKKSSRKGNYFSSFEAAVNERQKTIELRNASYEQAQYFRYALLKDGKFAPPSYESRNDAYRHSDGNAMIIKIGVKGNKVVSLSVA